MKIMSREMLISLGLLLLVFISGIGVGLFLGQPTSPAIGSELSPVLSPSMTAGSGGQSPNQADSFLNSRIHELEEELADQNKAQANAALSDRLAFFKKYQAQIHFRAFDDSLKITPEMAEILGLSEQEKQAVEKHLLDAKNEMQELEDDNTSLVKQTSNSATFEIPVDSRGDAIKATLNASLAADIGDDRAQFFMNEGGYSWNSDFANFAEQKREVEINWTQQQNGIPQYTVKDSTFGPNGTSQRSMSTSGGALPPQYQRFFQTAPNP